MELFGGIPIIAGTASIWNRTVAFVSMQGWQLWGIKCELSRMPKPISRKNIRNHQNAAGIFFRNARDIIHRMPFVSQMGYRNCRTLATCRKGIQDPPQVTPAAVIRYSKPEGKSGEGVATKEEQPS